jgi:hypothetical protein
MNSHNLRLCFVNVRNMGIFYKFKIWYFDFLRVFKQRIKLSLVSNLVAWHRCYNDKYQQPSLQKKSWCCGV